MKSLIEQVKQSLSYLDGSDKFRLLIAVLAQIGLAFLDLAAATSLGIVGVIAAVSISNSSTPNVILRLEEFLGIAGYPAANQITILSFSIVALFVTKTIGSLYLNHRVLRFLALRQVSIASEIWKNILKEDYLKVAKYPRQELVQAITDSLNVSIIGILGSFMLVVAEVILLFFLFVLLSLLYPTMAALILSTLGLLAYVTQNWIGKKNRNLNADYSSAAVASKSVMIDALSVLPEIKVSGHLSHFIDKFTLERAHASRAYVKSLWLGQVPKYVLEIGLVLSGILVFLVTQETSTAVDAIGKIAVFFSVSSRLVPSILRLQALLIGLYANVGTSKSINSLREELLTLKDSSFEEITQDSDSLSKSIPSHPVEIMFEDVSFRYEEGTHIFEFGDFYIPKGKTVAIIGRSGVGKTTLVQLVLGLIQPETGTIKLNGQSPINQIAARNGSVSYLPQNIAVVSGSIAENIALGLPIKSLDASKLSVALEVAALNDWVMSLPQGVNTRIDESGLNFSGGQLQRIGIARAVYSRPDLIILDEPTSSLDKETENAFLGMLTKLRGHATILIITHKVTTLDYVDNVIILEQLGNKVKARFMDSNSARLQAQKSDFEN